MGTTLGDCTESFTGIHFKISCKCQVRRRASCLNSPFRICGLEFIAFADGAQGVSYRA